MSVSVDNEPRPSPRFKPAPIRARRIVAVGGGKGGIGKSLLSANLGIELAGRGNSVALLDFDLGGANLHTCLGLAQPKGSLSDFVLRKVERLDDVAVETGIPRLRLVSGAGDSLGIANPLHQQKLRLMRAVQGLDVDVAIVDLGAGSHYNVLDFFLVADHGILTLVPEPTSIENAYRFLKAAFFRRLKAVESVYGLQKLLAEAQADPASGLLNPAQLLAAVRSRDAAAGEALEREMRAFQPLVVVNQVREAADLSVGEGVCAVWRRFFGLDLTYLGFLRHDPEAWRTARERRPLVVEKREHPLAQDVRAIADKLLSLPAPREGSEA